jgi:hypothetical protein
VITILSTPFIIIPYLILKRSNHPTLRGLPVTVPYSFPCSRIFVAVSLNNSVGKLPSPTREVYALTIPITLLIFLGGIPVPAEIPKAFALEEVPKG